MSPAESYRVPRHIDLLMRPIGGDVLIYNCASADTHLLDQNGSVYLAMLVEQEQTRESLLARSEGLDLSVAREDLPSYVDQALEQFVALGLIEETGDKTIDS